MAPNAAAKGAARHQVAFRWVVTRL